MYIHTMEYYLVLKRKETFTCCRMDEPSGHDAQWFKPATERKIVRVTWFEASRMSNS